MIEMKDRFYIMMIIISVGGYIVNWYDDPNMFLAVISAIMFLFFTFKFIVTGSHSSEKEKQE